MNLGPAILFNSFTGSIIEVAAEEKPKIIALIQGDLTGFEDHDIEILKECGALIERDFNEYLHLKHWEIHSRQKLGLMGLTILPTLRCNFDCNYCFSQEQSQDMDISTIVSIAKAIESRSEDIKALSICWFGGEPLMRLDLIEEFYNQVSGNIRRVPDRIITNGYLLYKHAVDTLTSI